MCTATKGVSVRVHRQKWWAVTGDCQGPEDASQGFCLVRMEADLLGGGVQGASDRSLFDVGQETESLFRGVDAMQATAEVLENVVKAVLGPEMGAEMRCKGKAPINAVAFTVCYAHLVRGAATVFHLAGTLTAFMLQFKNGREINPNSSNH